MSQSGNKEDKINFLIEENKKYKAISDNFSQNKNLNDNLLKKLKILQLENIKLQEKNKESSFYLNKIKLLQDEVENLRSSDWSSKEESSSEEELKLLRDEVLYLKIQIKNMRPGGKADPTKAARQTVISNQKEKNESMRYKKKAEEMKFFLKKKDIYKEYSTWKRRI